MKANLEDDSPKRAEEILTDSDQFKVKTEKEEWQGRDIRVKSAPLIDPGVGKAVVLRNFWFSKNPEFKGHLTTQELFNMHWKQISTLLFSDGWEPDERFNPRVNFKGERDYCISITCKPRFGVVLADTPQTLNQLLKKKKK